MSLGFKPKIFLKPKTELELVKYLQDYSERAKIIAGGTGIYEIAHRGLISDVEALIDINGLGLSYVREETRFLKIGASTTMSTIRNSPEIVGNREFSALLDALKAIQPLQVKNVASIAGAICTALPFFDLPVALLSLEASVEIGPSGRKLELSKFLRGYFSVQLEHGEFVREIELPFPENRNGFSSAFQKFSLTGDDWAIMNSSVSARVDHQHRISGSIIFFGGGVGEKPVRARKVESELQGVMMKDETGMKKIFEENVPKELEPISDIRSSSEYRMRLAKVLGRRTLLTACERALANTKNAK